MLRRLLALGGLVAAFVFGLKASRRMRRPQERVDLYFEDGSLVTLTGDEAEPLLAVVRAALA